MENKTCQNCKKDFTIAPEDFEFYDKIGVPPPTFCPNCRLGRRLTWRNERALHKRACSLCEKSMVAMYPDGTVFPVYCRECWLSDKWDTLSYGREYDFSKPFFAQFKELQNVVPRLPMQAHQNVNSDYTNQTGFCKDCYLISSSNQDENCCFGYRIISSKDVYHALLILRGEKMYDTVECIDSSRVIFSEDIANSFDLAFCFDVRGSNSCFMSCNLRRSAYVFRNEQLIKEEYERRISEVDFGSHTVVEELKAEFRRVKQRALHRFANSVNAVDFSGQTVTNAKNCHYCFNVAEVENCKYCLFVNNTKDSMDVNNGCCTMERVYETSSVGSNVADILFSAEAWPEVQRLTYTDTCRNGATDIFGCISIQKKSFCILNKQYSKEAFDELRLKVIEHMREMPYIDSRGIAYAYGEFFPAELSPYPYNDTSAQEFFPLDAVHAQELGLTWREDAAQARDITLRTGDIPDSIKSAEDSILQHVIECAHGGQCEERCTTAFKLIPQELDFYRSMNVPLPRLCPNCRYFEHFKKRNPVKLWPRKCMKPGCPNEFETSYSPERPEIVYCESCYNAEVV